MRVEERENKYSGSKRGGSEMAGREVEREGGREKGSKLWGYIFPPWKNIVEYLSPDRRSMI